MNRLIVALLLVLVLLVGFFGFHTYRRERQEDLSRQRAAEAAEGKQKFDQAADELEASVAAMGFESSLGMHGVKASVKSTAPGRLTVHGRTKDKAAVEKLLSDPAHAALLRDQKITTVIFKDETGSETVFPVN